MDNEEEFKYHLEKLIDSKEFPFEEKEWAKAKQLIDNSKRKRRTAYIVFAGLLLLIGGLTGVYLLNPPHPLADNQKISIKENPAASVSAPVPSVTSPLEKQNIEKPQVSNPRKTNNFHSTEAESPLDNKKQTNSPVKEPSITPTPVPAIAPNNSSELQVGIYSNPAATTKIKKINNQVENQSDENNVQSTIPLNVAVSVHTQSEIKSDDNKPDAEISAQPVSKTLPAEEEKTMNKQVEPPVENNLPAVAVISVTPPEPVAAEQLVPVKTDAIAVKDSMATIASKPDTASVAPVTASNAESMRFSIEAGATWLNGWKNEGGRDANGFNPMIGINYYYPLVNKITLSAGIQYNAVGNLGYYSHTSKSTRYTTGDESRVTVITPLKLHYLVAPLKLNYALNRNDVLGFGLNIAYLANVTSRMETYTLRRNTKEDVVTGKTHGYTDGFKNIDTQFSMFYRRHIHKGFHVNIEVIVGAVDIKDNTFFDSQRREQNLGFKLSLVYKILNR